MVSFKFLIANALTTATAVATPLVLRSVPQINIDLTTVRATVFPSTTGHSQSPLSQIALQIRRICFTSIIAARGPGLNYLSYDIVYAILATSIAAKNATTDTTNTAAFTEAQCTRLLNATDAGVPGALKVALPYLAAADSKLLESGCWNDSKAALALVKTNLHVRSVPLND